MEEQPINFLFAIPEEVIYNNILPFLKYNDLLRLRRVCKATKLISEDYIRNNFADHEREINESNHTFGDFIQLNLPTSRIYINNGNSGSSIFEDLNIPEFLNLFGNKITHLRVKRFSTCISKWENDFFLGLTNLQHLEIEETDARERKLGYSATRVNGVMVPRELCYFPETFKNLKTLILEQIESSDAYDQNYALDIVQFCSNLEHVKHPNYKKKMPEGTSSYQDGPFALITEKVKKSLKLNPNDKISLKSYDLEHHHDDDFFHRNFLDLLLLCAKYDLKLMNVDVSIFSMVGCMFPSDYDKFSGPLVSVNNVHGYMFLAELPNLEKVVITSTKRCSYGKLWNAQLQNRRQRQPKRPVPKWPKLELLDMNIDSDEMRGFDEVDNAETEELLDFFFATVKRPGLRNLRIGFKTGINVTALPCPKVQDIVETCKNLTRITLSNWIGTDSGEVAKLWNGLPLLEEVVLERCRTLSNVAFVGENKHAPAFLKLENLKKLTLVGLDSMPKITNHVFEQVFCHLKIKAFYLTSEKPVVSVTTKGIRSLITGQFNDSVEKFPFQGWSLKNVSEEEFNQLKTEFRATFMV